jgi:hypothetical protein
VVQSSCLGNDLNGYRGHQAEVRGAGRDGSPHADRCHPAAMPVTPVGACSTCLHQKIIRSGRGSTFSMCLRHKTDPAFAKYPPLPVLRCPGYERRESAPT